MSSARAGDDRVWDRAAVAIDRDGVGPTDCEQTAARGADAAAWAPKDNAVAVDCDHRSVPHPIVPRSQGGGDVDGFIGHEKGPERGLLRWCDISDLNREPMD